MQLYISPLLRNLQCCRPAGHQQNDGAQFGHRLRTDAHCHTEPLDGFVPGDLHAVDADCQLSDGVRLNVVASGTQVTREKDLFAAKRLGVHPEIYTTHFHMNAPAALCSNETHSRTQCILHNQVSRLVAARFVLNYCIFLSRIYRFSII